MAVVKFLGWMALLVVIFAILVFGSIYGAEVASEKGYLEEIVVGALALLGLAQLQSMDSELSRISYHTRLIANQEQELHNIRRELAEIKELLKQNLNPPLKRGE